MFEIRDALADLNSFDARDGHNVARFNLVGFIAIESAKRVELGDLGRHKVARKFHDAHIGAALERAFKNARDGQPSEILAVIEIGNLNLQRGRGIS